MVALYADESSFAGMTNAIRTLRLSANHATVEASLPTPERFAVAVYQDINADGQLNRNRFGIPIEPFAFSNNAMGNRGPPSFQQAVVVIPAASGTPIPGHFTVPITLP